MESRAGTVLVVGGGKRGLLRILRSLGFHPLLVHGREQALAFEELKPALLVVDATVDGVGTDLLEELASLGHPTLVIADHDQKLPDRPGLHPVRGPLTRASLEAVVKTVQRQPNAPGEPGEMEFLGLSPQMAAIRQIVRDLADTDATVLILGESGVGKDLIARSIHACSSRRQDRFVKVNCAALPGELLESELFGYEKGAFTGAFERRPGKFEIVGKGTMFLDEIGELPRPLQAKLLHVIQDLEFYRIGGREAIRVESRLVASTNRDLQVAMATGEFREDLFYRLNVVEIRVPPLRERRDEIPVLARLFLDKFNRQYSRHVELDPGTLELFQEHAWPGNVRELENMVRRLVVLGNVQHVHAELRTRLRAAVRPSVPQEPTPARTAAGTLPRESLGLKEIARQAAQDAERHALEEVLERVRWNRAEAARVLRVSYKTLLSKMTELGLGRARRSEM